MVDVIAMSALQISVCDDCNDCVLQSPIVMLEVRGLTYCFNVAIHGLVGFSAEIDNGEEAFPM